MSEYGISYRSFFHDLTPNQIDGLAKSLLSRRRKDFRELIIAIHAADPEKVLDSLEEETQDITEITQAQIDTLNIKVINKPE